MKKIVLLSICILALFISIYTITTIWMKDNNQHVEIKRDRQPPIIDKKEKLDIIILKFAHYFPESHPQHIALVEKFVPIVEEGSNWKIRVEVYPNNQLGGEKEYIQGVRNGTIEMGLGGQSITEILPSMKVIEFPYIFDSYDQAKAILNGEVGDKITKGIDALGMHSLAWSLNGFRQISTYEKFKTDHGQTDKLKLATIFSKPNIDTLKVMGFDVLPLDMNEMSIVLKQQVIDGHDNPPLLSYYNGWNEKQKEITITNHIISPAMYMISSKFWDTLSEEYKELIWKASRESADYEIELLKEVEKEIFNTLKDKGVEIVYPKLDAYKDAVYPLYEGWIANNSEIKSIFDEVLNEKMKIREKLKKQ
ncbi:MAG: TRAP-type transport system periplasmic protein [Clostridiales bacterium]|nr:TRAP-type transport system periplasmic protein [Clostridiales bacterium]